MTFHAASHRVSHSASGTCACECASRRRGVSRGSHCLDSASASFRVPCLPTMCTATGITLRPGGCNSTSARRISVTSVCRHSPHEHPNGR